EHLGEVMRVQFDATGKWLAAAGTKAVAAWAIHVGPNGVNFEQRVNLRIPETFVYDLALRPDGSALAFLTQTNPGQPARLYRYDLGRKEEPKLLDVPAQVRPRGLAFDPSGR